MVKTRNMAARAGALDLDQFIAQDAPHRFNAKAAATLQKLLLAELDATTLPQSLKNEIAASITINQASNGGVSVSIKSTRAGDIEFGTRSEAEQPFIARAQMQAEWHLPALLAETVRQSAAGAKGRTMKKGDS